MDMNGKWKLVSAENIPEICDVLGTTAENKDLAIKLMSLGSNGTQYINIDGDNVSIIYNIPGKTIKIDTKMGQPVDMPFFDGRMLKCVFSVNGDNIVENQTGAFEAVNICFRQGSQLVLKMTAKGVTTTRVYDKE
ncbi:fatty acid-binding protein 10-A, liver basic-like [Ruditapes philippinarum]|uniref:fatty acid-binding protein 10-A, liver basic-like n=1 Tax=Ruditapes philippinarum TaxID=129788 RepID=UPI00295B5C40|nr:fatty acid-binding protein 10-A, liver basic-like [Ruditapes philippinarum]